MQKTFSIIVANKKPARQVDAIKHEIKKYVTRERRRDLPKGFHFWDFACQIGASQEVAEDIHLSNINVMIDKIVSQGNEEFFVKVIAKPRTRKKKENHGDKSQDLKKK